MVYFRSWTPYCPVVNVYIAIEQHFGKSTISMAIFNSKLWVYQRVININPSIIHQSSINHPWITSNHPFYHSVWITHIHTWFCSIIWAHILIHQSSINHPLITSNLPFLLRLRNQSGGPVLGSADGAGAADLCAARLPAAPGLLARLHARHGRTKVYRPL